MSARPASPSATPHIGGAARVDRSGINHDWWRGNRLDECSTQQTAVLGFPPFREFLITGFGDLPLLIPATYPSASASSPRAGCTSSDRQTVPTSVRSRYVRTRRTRSLRQTLGRIHELNTADLDYHGRVRLPTPNLPRLPGKPSGMHARPGKPYPFINCDSRPEQQRCERHQS
jgi:hypothetical protein